MELRPNTGAAKLPAVLVGRQPILDSQRHVFGYELMFRAADAVSAAEVTNEGAAAQLISDAVVAIGLDKLTHGRRAFIKLPSSFIERGLARVLPADRVVLEIPSDLPADSDLVEACKQLTSEGYAVALDQFTMTERSAALLPMASYLKADFRRTPQPQTTPSLTARWSGRNIGTIANRVDAIETFEDAVRQGFSHAQGYFFERSPIVRSKALPQGHITSLRLLRALNDANRSLADIEDLVKHDSALCYRILRTVNSFSFYQSREITSMRHALLLLGRDTVRRWASLWVMAGLSTAAHNELILMASIRGRFCEILSTQLDGPDAAGESFLVGMCSLFDAILDRPMTDIVQELSLSSKAAGALLGQPNSLRNLIDCVIAYDRADWNTCLPLVDAAKLRTAWLPPAYAEALRWANEIVRPTKPAVTSRSSIH